MRRTILSLAVVSLVALGSGCAANKEEQARLTAEREQFRSQFESQKKETETLQARLEKLDKELTDAKAELEQTKNEMTAARLESEKKLKEAQDAADARVKAIQNTLTAANKKSAASLKEANEKIAAMTSDLNAARANATAQGATLADKIVVLEKKVETLTRENATLRDQAKSGEGSTTAPAAATPMP